METTQTPAEATAKPRRAFKQVVLRELGQVGKYRVRLVKPSDKPDAPTILDVREYVQSAGYEGFTRKGVRLAGAEAAALRAILESLSQESAFA